MILELPDAAAGVLHSHPWVQRLAGCPLDPRHHQEGDALVHTRMTCEALLQDPAYLTLESADRGLVLAAALLHEIGRPVTTHQDPEGRWTSRHHASVGAILTRRLLYEEGVPFRDRETICSLVRHHLRPFHLIDDARAVSLALLLAVTTRIDLLQVLARADANGRRSDARQALLDNVELFREFCEERGLVAGALPFASAHSRFVYFRSATAAEPYEAHHEPRCEVTVLSGLPGAGKDHWIATSGPEVPGISLDDIRRSMGIRPADAQGEVIARAFAQAKDHLRRRQSFLWNATNLSRQLRSQLIDVAAAYEARVKIVYIEASAARQRRQNAEREHPVRENIIDQMMKKWEVPDLTEAHDVEYIVDGKTV